MSSRAHPVEGGAGVQVASERRLPLALVTSGATLWGMDTPRTIRAEYHPERLTRWLAVLGWLALVAGAARAVLALRASGGWETAAWALAGGAAAALGMFVARAALTLLAEIRDAAVSTHNLLGEERRGR